MGSIDVGLAGNSVYGITNQDMIRLDASNGNKQFQQNSSDNLPIFNSLRAGPNGDFFYTGNDDTVLKKRDSSDASIIWTSKLDPESAERIPVEEIIVGPNNEYVYARSKKILLARGFSKHIIRKIIPEDGSKLWDKQIGGRDIEISPGGSFLYTANRNGRLGKYNANVNED